MDHEGIAPDAEDIREGLLALGLRVAVGPGLPWVVLIGLGLLMQGLTSVDGDLSSETGLTLYVVGGLALIGGTAGLGAQIGRHRADETLRLKLAPAFRRTFRMYRRLAALQKVIGDERREIAARVRSNGTVELESVEAGFAVVGARLDEQVLTVDDAMDEWNELTPLEVKRLRDSVENEW